MVSSSSKSSVTSAPSCTVRRFLCSMTRARNALRSRAYASRDSRLSRVIMALLDGGLDLRKGARHLAARLHRHAELARDLRERKDAAHHGAPRRRLEQPSRRNLVKVDHQRVLASGAPQRLEHMPDARALHILVSDRLDELRGRHHVRYGELVAPQAAIDRGAHGALAENVGGADHP